MITAPVARFEAVVDQDGGRIIGYAAPAHGMAPCRVQVRNGGRLVAAVAAIDFVGNHCPLRLGWCGFTLPLRSGFFALDDYADLVCATSGRTLLVLSLDLREIPDPPSPSTGPVAIGVRDLTVADTHYIPVDGIVRLVQAIVFRTSADKGVDALYQMLLARHADAVGLENYRKRMTNSTDIERVVRSMMGSEEHANLLPELKFRSPYRSSNAVEALLALSDTVEDLTNVQTCSGQVPERVVIGLRDLIMADRVDEERLIRQHRHRTETLRAETKWDGDGRATGSGRSDLWMAEIATALLVAPVWWGFLPRSWQLRKMSAKLRRAGLFDSPAYLRRYPDVAQAGLDPLEHYLRHGRNEGRSII